MEVTPGLYDRTLLVVCDRAGLLALSCRTGVSVPSQDSGKQSSQSGIRMERPAQRAPGGHRGTTVYTGPSPRELSPQSWAVPVAAAWPLSPGPLERRGVGLRQTGQAQSRAGTFPGLPLTSSTLDDGALWRQKPGGETPK